MASSLLTFQKDSLNARRSSVTVGSAYTQLNQILLYFPFQLYPQNQKYWISGEVGYYRYVYNFFGIGNGFPNDFVEKYTADYPRVRLNVAKKVRSNIFLGVRYAFDNFKINAIDTGFLVKNNVVGSKSGLVSGLGVAMTYDTRNQIFYPTAGWLLDAHLHTEGGYTGSDFAYQRLVIDAARYINVGKNNMLALNAVAVASVGDVPFHQMALLGGGKRLRGYFEGKYRDKDLFLLQSEWRFPVLGRFGGVVFAPCRDWAVVFRDVQQCQPRILDRGDPCRSVICGGVVYDDELDVSVSLPQDARDSVFNVSPIVVEWDDNGNQWVAVLRIGRRFRGIAHRILQAFQSDSASKEEQFPLRQQDALVSMCGAGSLVAGVSPRGRSI